MEDDIEELTFTNSVFSGDVTIDFTSNQLIAGSISGTVGQYTTGFSGPTLKFSGDADNGYILNGIGGMLSRETLTFSGTYPKSISGSVYIQATGNNGAADQPITVTPLLCFAMGTRIRTIKGDVPIENLKLTDVIVTDLGAQRSLTWIGHRKITCTPDTWPIRILHGTFGSCLPEQDLYLSPGHPVLVGEWLVPVMCLINGTTIERVPVDEVTYWHVELDEHDILLAEGLPAESYIDLGSRPWFAGADGELYDPDLALPGMLGRCRPVAVDGPIVEAERRRLDMMFATRLADACAWPSSEFTTLENVASFHL